MAETSRVPGIVDDLGPFRQWANRALRAAADDSSRSSRERLHAQLALLPAGLVNPQSLIDPLLIAPPEEFRAILGMLSPHRHELAGPLWTVVKSADRDRGRRLRAACALATFDPDEAAWHQIAPDVASLLLAENPLLVNEWVDMLRPVGRSLARPAGGCLRRAERPRRPSARDQYPGRLLQRRPRAARRPDRECRPRAIRRLPAGGRVPPRGRNPFTPEPRRRRAPESHQASRI